MSDVVIALDQGSSSSRALAFNEKGKVIARAQYPVKMSHPKPGFVEHDPLELARSLERALDDVLAALSSKDRVAALGFASQRSTVVLWDAESGKPVVPALSWMDGRAGNVVAKLSDRQEDVHERTGLYLTPFYSAPKVRHVLDHEPKARVLLEEGRLRIGPVSSYVLWRLSKGEVFATDPAMAQRMLLYNIRTGVWDERLLAMFGIPKECLPAVVPTAGSWAVIARKRRKLPLLAVMGDQQSAAYGQDVGEGVGVLNYGTGAFLLLHTGEKLHRIPGILTSVAWQKHGRPPSFFLEGTVHAVGTSFEWLRKNLGLLKNVKGVDAACRKSTHRVWALQAIGGLGAPRWDYKTPTVYMGLLSKTRPEDLVRGVTESIAFLISDIAAAISGAGLAIRELRASGGLARVDWLLQFQSDILQSRILRLRESEATAKGAAAMAAEEARLPWAANLRGGKFDAEFRPRMERQAAQKLLRGWRVFAEGQRELAASLRGLGVLD